jgi:hypothetical protein
MEPPSVKRINGKYYEFDAEKVVDTILNHQFTDELLPLVKIIINRGPSELAELLNGLCVYQTGHWTTLIYHIDRVAEIREKDLDQFKIDFGRVIACSFTELQHCPLFVSMLTELRPVDKKRKTPEAGQDIVRCLYVWDSKKNCVDQLVFTFKTEKDAKESLKPISTIFDAYDIKSTLTFSIDDVKPVPWDSDGLKTVINYCRKNEKKSRIQ